MNRAPELMILLIIVLIVFGSTKLPTPGGQVHHRPDVRPRSARRATRHVQTLRRPIAIPSTCAFAVNATTLSGRERQRIRAACGVIAPPGQAPSLKSRRTAWMPTGRFSQV